MMPCSLGIGISVLQTSVHVYIITLFKKKNFHITVYRQAV